MSSIIEIRNETIKIITYKKKLKEVVILDECLMKIDEVIKDPFRLHNFMGKAAINNKVDLIFNNKETRAKILELPQLEHKRMKHLVHNDFMRSLSLKEKHSSDYMILDSYLKDSMTYCKVLAVALEDEVIHKWIETLRLSSYRIQRMQSIHSCLVWGVDSLGLSKDNISILSVEEGQSTLYYFEKGKLQTFRTLIHTRDTVIEQTRDMINQSSMLYNHPKEIHCVGDTELILLLKENLKDINLIDFKLEQTMKGLPIHQGKANSLLICLGVLR